MVAPGGTGSGDRRTRRARADAAAGALGGLLLADMHVVITPQRPVACAGRAVAARLAGETSEASVTLPWQRLADLPWL